MSGTVTSLWPPRRGSSWRYSSERWTWRASIYAASALSEDGILTEPTPWIAASALPFLQGASFAASLRVRRTFLAVRGPGVGEKFTTLSLDNW
jgi:hypothetical protein